MKNLPAPPLKVPPAQSLLLLLLLLPYSLLLTAQSPVRVVMAGISHGHADWLIGRPAGKDIELAGIYERDRDLATRYVKQLGLSENIIFDNLEKMLDAVKPEAAMAFGPINEHLAVVRACAPRGIHVMVEKPLATTLADAREMARLAKQFNIKVLTNFETSWYASNQHVQQLLRDGKLGQLRKVMVNDGHQGPKEIGVSKEFLAWLTDPVQNGGGALMDFGCYGANLMTWLTGGQRPLSVTAVTRTNKPSVYPKVDDEATIILQYPGAQCIIQASWNWTFNRKDMEVYGDKGYAIAVNRTTVRQRLQERVPEETLTLPPREAPWEDPFAVLAAVVRGTVTLDANDLYELPVNVIAVEILEAAKKSARTGKRVWMGIGD